jgi:hypothetical protein
MRKVHTSILHCVIALLCLVAVPVIDYADGWRGMPLAILLLPAQVVPAFIWLVSVIKLITAVIRSIVAKSQVYLTCGTFVVVLLSTWAMISFRNPGLICCYGLKGRFVHDVGYTKMREFAKEVSQKQGFEMLRRDSSNESMAIWDDLARRYSFLNWNESSGTILARGGVVGLSWGSPLIGHQGFDISLDGKPMAPQERSQFLRVSEDIQFFCSAD